MSNALAIAAVTETLVQYLTNAIVGPSKVPDAWVSSVTPDRSAGLANPGVNVFLYQVTPNVANRNADMPTRTPDGSLIRKPCVALDLHYLLTFYGDESALVPQRLLGATVLALHRTPTMQRAIVQPAPTQPLSQQHHLQGAADSGLAAQSQLIRFTPITYSLEELSKLWSFLLKVDYVLSTAYVASVLLIETDDPAPPEAPPALNYALGVLPIRQPTIQSIVNADAPGSAITAGSSIAISGANLVSAAGAAIQVLINSAPHAPTIATSSRIVVKLPTDSPAGPTSVQVAQPLLLGTPAAPRAGTGTTSSVFPFVLLPTISSGSIVVSNAAGPPPGRTLQCDIVPLARTGQRAVLLLTGGSPPTPRLVDGGTVPADTGTLTFPLPTLTAGSYFVQVLIDGAQSPLTPAGAPTGPTVAL